ncbi:MAG: hypothetical protein GY701_20510, partial [Sulfitobacter sp.]|nr:hypothetical protein [Sulfitobacter sp.]
MDRWQTPGVGALDDGEIRLSAGARRAETTPIGFAFYNIGIQNDEVGKKNWPVKVNELERDVKRIISRGNVQAIFLCEFGNMLVGIQAPLYELQADRPSPTPTIKVVQEFFNSMLARLGLTSWEAYTDAPYVALVDVSIWEVKVHEMIKNMCSHPLQRAQHLLLEHALSERQVRVLNNHSAGSTANTNKRKQDIVVKMLSVCTGPDHGGVAQPVAAWVIGGDGNLSEGVVLSLSRRFLQAQTKCVSNTGHPVTTNPQKADFALSHGIVLAHTTSWVGAHSPPCASDVHDCVFVLGDLEVEHEGPPSDVRELRQPEPPLSKGAAAAQQVISLRDVAAIAPDHP